MQLILNLDKDKTYEELVEEVLKSLKSGYIASFDDPVWSIEDENIQKEAIAKLNIEKTLAEIRAKTAEESNATLKNMLDFTNRRIDDFEARLKKTEEHLDEVKKHLDDEKAKNFILDKAFTEFSDRHKAIAQKFHDYLVASNIVGKVILKTT